MRWWRGCALATVIVLAAAVAGPLDAAPFSGQTLRVQFWPGATASAIQKYIVDPFVKKTGANVVVEYGNTSNSIAKARAQKNDPQLDVLFMDDVGVLTLAREGILEQLDLGKLPHAREIYAGYIVGDRYGMGVFSYAVTLLYNNKVLPSPPTSWRDLWDARYRGKILGPPANITQALLLTVMAAKLGGGGLDNLDPAWGMLRQLKPNIHSFPQNFAIAAELMKSGEAVMTVNTIPQFKAYIEQGYPIAPAYPKEGYFATTSAVVLVRGSKARRDLAYAFIDEALTPEAQGGVAEQLWYSPTNPRAPVSPATRKYIVTPTQYRKAIPLDLEKLLKARPQIIDQWNKIFTQ